MTEDDKRPEPPEMPWAPVPDRIRMGARNVTVMTEHTRYPEQVIGENIGRMLQQYSQEGGDLRRVNIEIRPADPKLYAFDALEVRVMGWQR